jgi:hypothetical protein
MSHAITVEKVVEHKSASNRFAAVVWLAMTIVVLCVIAPWPSRAADLEWLSVGVRAQTGEKRRVLGKEQPESFREYDVVASIQLPWEGQSSSGWGTGARLLASAGVLQGANKTALVASVIPALALGRQDGRFTVELGAGLALLSRHRYAQQDYGGPIQFALTFGVGVPLNRRVGVGYRFMHYSDAGAYGPATIGADFHMIELNYLF